jgi:hypothetical protein
LKYSDFLNYGSVVASALFAALSWWSSRKEARERVRQALPVIECKASWAAYPNVGVIADFVLQIQNNYNETISVERIRAQSREKITISFAEKVTFTPNGIAVEVVEGTSNTIIPEWKIERRGSQRPASIHLGGRLNGDNSEKNIHCFGLSSSAGGSIVLIIWLRREGFASSRRKIVLKKRYALKAHKPALSQTHTTSDRITIPQ